MGFFKCIDHAIYYFVRQAIKIPLILFQTRNTLDTLPVQGIYFFNCSSICFIDQIFIF